MSNLLRKSKSLFSTTITAGISTGTEETVTLSSVSGLPTDTEITITIDRVNAGGTTTTDKMERIIGTISGSNLVIRTSPSSGRGADNTTEQAHSSGAVVECIWNGKDWNDMIDSYLVEHNDAGTHKAALVTTLKATGANINTGTSDTTIVTPKAIADSTIAKVKAVGSEVTTGTDDVKYVTAKAIKDASIIATPVKASGAEVTTGTDDAKFATAKALADADVNTRLKTACGTFTKNIADANGTQDVNLSFTPTYIEFKSAISGAIQSSDGYGNGSVNYCKYTPDFAASPAAGKFTIDTTSCITTIISNSAYYTATVAFSTNKATITWTKTGSPTGSLVVVYTAYR